MSGEIPRQDPLTDQEMEELPNEAREILAAYIADFGPVGDDMRYMARGTIDLYNDLRLVVFQRDEILISMARMLESLKANVAIRRELSTKCCDDWSCVLCSPMASFVNYGPMPNGITIRTGG